jgi:hypothetical protein
MPSSPWRRIRLASIAAGLMAQSIRSDQIHHRQLGTSHGCRDHTVLPYARCARSRITALQTRFAPDAAASTASRLAFVTTRDPPLLSRRDARKKPLIWGGWEAEYFCAGGWMTQISRKLFNKSPFVRNDSGSLCRAGASRKDTRPSRAWSSKVYVCGYFRWPFESLPDRSGAASGSIAAVLSCRS